MVALTEPLVISLFINSAKSEAASFLHSHGPSTACLARFVMGTARGGGQGEKPHCSTASDLSPDIAWPVFFLANSPLDWEAAKPKH